MIRRHNDLADQLQHILDAARSWATATAEPSGARAGRARGLDYAIRHLVDQLRPIAGLQPLMRRPGALAVRIDTAAGTIDLAKGDARIPLTPARLRRLTRRRRPALIA
ncbi:MAG: hypothetical protein AAF772_06360 [Acidobacteriota bacterium]